MPGFLSAAACVAFENRVWFAQVVSEVDAPSVATHTSAAEAEVAALEPVVAVDDHNVADIVAPDLGTETTASSSCLHRVLMRGALSLCLRRRTLRARYPYLRNPAIPYWDCSRDVNRGMPVPRLR